MVKRARSPSAFRTLSPGQRQHPADTGTREARRHRRTWLPPLRSQRRRALRQNGPQRHRIWPYGRLRGGSLGAFCATPTAREDTARCRTQRTTPLRGEHYQYDLNLRDVTEVWRLRERSIASWLLDLTAAALKLNDPALSEFAGRVSGFRRGRAWTIKAAIDEGGAGARPLRCALPAVNSLREGKPTIRTGCCRRCATGSADTWRRQPPNKRATRPNGQRSVQRRQNKNASSRTNDTRHTLPCSTAMRRTRSQPLSWSSRNPPSVLN